MKILFATGRPFYPDLYGGAERSMQGLLMLLKQKGHECEGIATHARSLRASAFAAMRAFSRKRIKATRDQRAGFPVWRTRPWLLEDVFLTRMRALRPDIVLTQLGWAGEIANWALLENVRPMIFLRDNVDRFFSDSQARNDRIGFVANSEYMAIWAEETFGRRPCVIYPPVNVASMRTARAPHFVTFINPVKKKGLELALAVAEKLPHIPFLFVESWPLTPEEELELNSRLERFRNIEFWRRRRKVQEIYDVTRLLIVPSLWQEPFGRVIIEAQACGIPVLGRKVGGIPEAVGAGGIVLRTSADSDEWAATIESLIEDSVRMSVLRAAAVENARLGPWAPNNVVASVESLLFHSLRPQDRNPEVVECADPPGRA